MKSSNEWLTHVLLNTPHVTATAILFATVPATATAIPTATGSAPGTAKASATATAINCQSRSTMPEFSELLLFLGQEHSTNN